MFQHHCAANSWIKKCALLIGLLGITYYSATPTFAISQFIIGDHCTGNVFKVFDADTLLFHCDTGATALVRLAGIDAPESSKKNKLCWQQPFGDTATALAQQQLLYKRLTLKITDQDKYHRWVGLLFDENNYSVNARLITQGLAHVYRHYPHAPEWEALESQAQKTKIGLWKNPTQCILQPHNWRRMTEAQRCAQEIIFQQEKCQF